MQLTLKPLPRSAQLIEFPLPMGTPPEFVSPLPTALKPSWWQAHGTTAAWGALAVALVVGSVNIATTIYFHIADANKRNSDDHTNILIDNKLTPAKNDINNHTDNKTDALGVKIDLLSDRVARIEGSLGDRVSKLETTTGQMQSLARLEVPGRVLALVRAEIENAQNTNRPVSPATLVDYKNAIQALPDSAFEYWTTVAAIINYQSKLNQMSGEAPDPNVVSHPCAGVTNDGNFSSSNNFISHETLSNCHVDLESGAFVDITFVNSVIHYKGGNTTLTRVRFVNCRFIIDVTENIQPVSKTFLLALLDSDQKSVSLATGL